MWSLEEDTLNLAPNILIAYANRDGIIRVEAVLHAFLLIP
jgi:hypothetical protein